MVVYMFFAKYGFFLTSSCPPPLFLFGGFGNEQVTDIFIYIYLFLVKKCASGFSIFIGYVGCSSSWWFGWDGRVEVLKVGGVGLKKQRCPMVSMKSYSHLCSVR